MVTRDREILNSFLRELFGVNNGSFFSHSRLVLILEHTKKCEKQLETDKENALLTKVEYWLDIRIKEWEKANNKTVGFKVCTEKNTSTSGDPWNKLSKEDIAFLKSCNIKPNDL